MSDLGPAPLVLEGVASRVFPLLASRSRLQSFCDSYLNVPGVAYFRPALPLVLFQALNYGRMSGQAFQLGWISQHEFLFMVILEWYEPNGKGGWRFKDWATVSPFIFVDDEISLQGGRDVFGWPKIFASIERESNPWMEDPRLPRRLLSLQTPLFSRLYRGEPLQERLLIRIEQESSETALRVPFDLAGAFGPLARGARTFTSSASALLDFLLGELNRFARLGLRGFSTPVVEIVERTMRSVLSGTQMVNAINLKQFRGLGPNGACYQALVRSAVTLNHFNAGGPLGEVALLRGDLSGGLRLSIMSTDAYPIVETLGLLQPVVTAQGDVSVTHLSPVLPFWMNVDLRYDLGERVCWRAPGTHWRTAVHGRPLRVPGKESDSDSSESSVAGSEEAADMPPEKGAGCIVIVSPEQSIPYNNTLGPMVSPVGGPLVFFDADIKLLPLWVVWRPGRHYYAKHYYEKAKKRLEVLLALKKPQSQQGEALPCVTLCPPLEIDDKGVERGIIFLVVTHNGQMSAAANDLGCWAKSSLQFTFLVKVHFADPDGEPKSKLFLLPVMDFANSSVAVTTGREARGLPSWFASIYGGANEWLEDPVGARELVRAEAKVFPALGVGQTVREEIFLKVIQPPIDQVDPAPTTLSEELPEELVFDYLSYRSYPAAEEPGELCYAGLVGWRALMGQLDKPESERERIEFQQLPKQLQVALLREPTLRIVSRLGLLCDHEELTEGGNVYDFCTTIWPPFWVHATMYWGSPEDLLWQVLVEDPLYVLEGSYEFLTETRPPYPHQVRLGDLLASKFSQIVDERRSEQPGTDTPEEPDTSPPSGA